MSYTISQVYPGDRRALKQVDALLQQEGIERDGNELLSSRTSREIGAKNREDLCKSFVYRYSVDSIAEKIPANSDGSYVIEIEAFDNAGSLITPTAAMHLDSHISDAVTVYTNRHHLLIVLTELLFNALHFTREGSVTMRIDATDGGPVRFTVEDTGPGIPEEKADFVFEKFTKLDMFTDGLGLGLFLCRRVVMLMGGTLTLDTRYTAGCRFVLELPRQHA